LTVLLNTTNCTAFAAISGALSGALRAALVRSRGFESDLRVLNDDLERKVRVAVSDLHVANRALNLRNRELGRTAEQAELFSRAVAHDLRNPLTAASEALRLLEGRGGRDREELIALAGENLIRADRMLIGLRDLIRTTGAGPAPGPVSVTTVVAEVIAELRAAGRLEGGEIELRALPELLGRREQLVHIFRNLMSNAVDHSGHRRHSIEVGHELRGGAAHYYVRDHGVGIPFELRERIFEPFRRGPAAAPDGLGLGLALVRSIVSQAGGRVWVEDTPGGGATFVFLLGSEGEPAGL
jgi:signal transduction histidine kinase